MLNMFLSTVWLFVKLYTSVYSILARSSLVFLRCCLGFFFLRIFDEGCKVALANLAQLPFAGGVVLDQLVNNAVSLLNAVSANQVALKR